MAAKAQHRVLVEYCDVCGYLQRYDALKAAIHRADPLIDVDGLPGRHGAFEVSVDRKWLVHSKLATRAFPETEGLIQQLLAFYRAGTVGAEWTEDEW